MQVDRDDRISFLDYRWHGVSADIFRLICATLLLVMIGVAAIVYHANLLHVLIFGLFILFYVQLPGQLILKIAGLNPGHMSTLLSTGFFIGWAFIVLQYFITQAIGTYLLLYAVGPILSAVYLLISLRASGEKAPGDRPMDGFIACVRNVSPAFCIFIVIGLLYSMMLTQYLYLSPEVDQTISMNPDKGFHMGLINSLSHGYPLECPWFSGLYFNYHIFTEMLYSIPISLFGLTADTMLFTCCPYLTIYAIGISFYSFFREFSSRDRAGMYCLILLLSNIFVARGIDRSIAFLFIFRNENVAGYAISATMVLAILIRYWYRDFSSGGFAWRRFVLVLSVLMLVTGIKGPFGLVILASLWGTYILGVILRQVGIRMILPLIIATMGFYLIYSVVLGSKGQAVGAESSLIALGNIANITFYKSSLVAFLKSMGIPSMIRYVVLLGVFTVFLLTCFFLPFVLGYLRELYLVFFKKKDFNFSRVLIYAACLVGFIALILLNYHGHSQIYFGFVTVFFAPMIAFWFFEDMAGNHRLPMKLLRGIFLVTLCLSTIGLVSFIHTQLGEASGHADPLAESNKYKSISHEEYEAMRWIDENTPRDSLLATDRYYSVPLEKFDIHDRWDNRFFLYADYSNRICYFAGAGYSMPDRDWKKRRDRIEINNQLLDAGNEDRGDLARRLGIDYVVVSKRFMSPDGLENEDYQRCFSNDDVDVFKVRQK